MELRQLRYLVAIADEGQFTRAAAREHVAQPALSQQIARLERTVGTRLVDRSARHSSLTQAGEILVERARRVIAEVDAAHADLADLAGLQRGRVAIGAMQTMGPVDLPGILADFHRRYPEVELVVREEISDVLAGLVRADQLDLAFLSVADRFDTEDLELVTLGEQRLVAVLPPDHPLATRKRLQFAELAGNRFVSFGRGAALHEILFEAGAEAGFSPQIAAESNEIPRIRAMVSRGLGVALLPRDEIRSPGPPTATAEITAPTVAMNVTLCWRARRHLGPAARTFLDLVRETLA
jgi:LysR family transcriptional activator of glutamate synthase operon